MPILLLVLINILKVLNQSSYPTPYNFRIYNYEKQLYKKRINRYK